MFLNFEPFRAHRLLESSGLVYSSLEGQVATIFQLSHTSKFKADGCISTGKSFTIVSESHLLSKCGIPDLEERNFGADARFTETLIFW